MLKYNSFFLVVVLALFGLTSCEKYFEDVNSDPNNPLDVPASVLLPSVQAQLAYTLHGDGSRYLSINTQHIDGISRQFTVIQNYGITGADVNTMWGPNLYAGILMDLQKLKEVSPEHTAVANVLEAYTMMFVTDMFGDVPYSDAFKGLESQQPIFDSQAEIYASIMTKLDEAITALPTSDLTGDLMYGGDPALWIKFAHTIKARGYLHQGKLGAANYQSALDEMASGITSETEGAYFNFGATPTSAAPWYQYNEQRNDIAPGANYLTLMTSLNDTMRANIFGASMTDYDVHPYFTINRRTPLISIVEAKFIVAECTFQTAGAAAAHPLYLEAIQSSFDALGLSTEYAAYVAQASVDPGAANLTINDIMTQKYIALFAEPEVFNDWRRTGVPTLTPNTGTTVPRRLPYPQDEVNFNTTNCPQAIDIFTDKVGWDI